MGLFYDSTYLLVILAALISMAVSARMNTIFSKYQTIRSYSGMTGREAAMRILHQAGIYDVTVRHVSGKLTDHYDPRTKTVNLSDAVYDSTSVAAIGVAAHECGHAVQHNTDYVPLKVRSAIVPAANLGSQLFWPLEIREKVRSEYVSMKRSRGRFVEMIVDFFRRMRSLMQRKSWEETKLLVSSVPKSSMIRRSQL